MEEIIKNLIRRMKVGAKYKRLKRQAYKEYMKESPKLSTCAKIKYNAQSTFHTIK